MVQMGDDWGGISSFIVEMGGGRCHVVACRLEGLWCGEARRLMNTTPVSQRLLTRASSHRCWIFQS